MQTQPDLIRALAVPFNFFILLITVFFTTLFNGTPARAADSQANVILFMLDGVRWQEFFHGTDSALNPSSNEPVIFKYLFSHLSKNHYLAGDLKNGSENTIANRLMISLPAYQSIMAGKTTQCRSNSCGRIEVETLQERLLRELKLKKTEVATIASWNSIADAVEHEKGRTFVNAGLVPIREGLIDTTTVTLNKTQEEDLPPWPERKDDATFGQAIAYLKNNKPRFLFISLNDSDEWAHKGEYLKYASTLKGYDQKIKSLFETLEAMGDYGQSTTVIITTDHGRGNGANWIHHGSGYPESKYTWIYARNPSLAQTKRNVDPAIRHVAYTHLDIRPTIEKLMGLEPIHCDKCGSVIQELIPEI